MSDRTIFCLGGRGPYENATRDLLRFFIDPAEEHGHGSLFFDALHDCVPDLAFRIDPSFAASREVRTDAGNRVDLVLESKNGVVVIENKHWSSVGNPLDDYERFARTRAVRKPGRSVDLILLGSTAEVLPAPWRFVSYRALIAALRFRLAVDHLRAVDERWRVLTGEFLAHLQIEAGEYDETQLAALLTVLRNEGGQQNERRLDEVRAKLVPFVSTRLSAALGEGCIRIDAWSTADCGHGWRFGDAIDFQVLDRKAADVFMSLAIRHSIADALAGPQLCLVSWVRPHSRRPDVAGYCRKRLEDLGFEEIGRPDVRHWESGRAFDRVLDGASLTEAIAELTHVMRSIRDVTAGWANRFDPLPFRE